MTETEIRNRLRDAFGEVEYPPALTRGVRSRLDRPQASGHPRLVALVSALLAVTIVATLVYIRAGAWLPSTPSTVQAPRVPLSSPGPPMIPAQQVPTADLAVAGLSIAVGLMSDYNFASTKNGRTVRLIGAYADPARIVLIFRTLPQAEPGLVEIYDDRGLINAGGGGGPGSLGDNVFVLDQGPHPGSDGVAHLTVSIPFLQQMPPAQGNLSQGPWNFAFALKVQPATTIALEPRPSTVGSWKVAVETFQLTPSVIHLQLLVTGASPDSVASAVNVLDDQGNTVVPLEGSTSALGSGLHLDYAWARPGAAATYRLQINGGGGRYAASFAVPAPAAPTPDSSVVPKLPGPYDLPTASELLTLQGAMAETVNFGHPWQCKVISDTSGSSFLLDMYFRSKSGAWYLLGLITDVADKPYSGPGSYGVRAYISPLATNGPADHILSGSGTMTVTSAGAPFAGTANATLGWDDDPNQQVSVSGGWTCG